MENPQDNNVQKEARPHDWEKGIIEKLAYASLDEQRKTRRWGILFKTLTLAYLIAILVIAMYPRLKSEITTGTQQHAAVVNVQGIIAEGKPAGAENIIDGLRDAFKDKNTKGVILNINSPGGSPVQAHYVYQEILRLKEKHPGIPIYAAVSDICASGGYYIAAAADKIFVDQGSIIGSIGVIMNGFGFVDAMKKVGVERRLFTAGRHKALLDPFSPVKPDETQHMQTLLDEVHQQFIDAVKKGRGERLANDPDLFSGLVWTGAQGIKLGLADDYGNVDSVARDVIGTEHKVDFTPQEKLLDRLTGKFGAAFGQALGSYVQSMSLQ